MRRNRFLTVVYTLVLALLIASCSNQQRVDRKEITVSILPYKFFAEKLTGGMVKVNCLLSPGDNHATYQPAPKQVEGLERSMIYFTNGLLVFEETWVPNFQRNNPELKIVNCSKGIQLLEGDHHHGHDDDGHSHLGDPHYWTLPTNAKVIVSNMYNALSKSDLIPKDSLDSHYHDLLAQLDTYSELMDATMSTTKRNKFMIYHPALSYISKHYALEQIAIEQEGKSPSVAQLKDVLDFATENELKHILIQKQFDKENASLVAKEINGEVLVIDPLDYDYFKSTLDLTQKLQTALND